MARKLAKQKQKSGPKTTTAAPVNPVFRRGDGREFARADLVQRKEGEQYVLRTAGGAYVDAERTPYEGVRVEAPKGRRAAPVPGPGA